ncbi:autotransporter outer membrane beta-barrel domain-containing protein [Qipengyuania sp. JC766]|uniref:autotransporter outer membrane beta-barrel domain-containing protein n=1 Tax=Qipengyuania sp. JC766 TaxID=3232139 RepID=UPI003458D530
MNRKSQLALGVASTALVIGLTTPAHAACAVDGATVTCTADSTAAEVDAALASVAGDDATLEIVTDATVNQPSNVIQPLQQGAVAIDNDGTIGTEAAPVGISYTGTSTDADNTVSLDNSGAISGPVNIFNVGGTIDIDNSGSIGQGLYVGALGAVTLNSDGDINSPGSQAVLLVSNTSVDAVFNGDVGTAATDTTDSDLRDTFVQTQFTNSVPSTSETETVGGVTTTTTTSGLARTGGSASVEVGENANTGAISVVALDGAEVSIDGTVGSETEFESVTVTSNTSEGSSTTVSSTDGTDSSFTQTSTNSRIGGTASISVSETGSVSGNVQANGLEGADIAIDGSVGTENSLGSASAVSTGTDFQNTNSNSTTGTVSASSSQSANQTVGGEASVSVGEAGSVAGSVTANGFAGAQVSIDGAVGQPTISGLVGANSSGSDGSFENASTFDSATGASSSSQLSSNSSTGGDASIAIGETGVVNALVDAFANSDASVSNAGQVSGAVSATASGSESSDGFENQSDGMGNGSSSSFFENAVTGGNALIENAESGVIGGEAAPASVSAFGNASATVTNAGEISGSVSANSSGTDSSGSSENEFDALGNFYSSNSSADVASGGDAIIENAAGGLIGLDATAPVFVSAFGNASATVSNAGRINGNVDSSSSGFASENQNANAFAASTDAVTGVVTSVSEDVTANSSTNLGGDASFANAEGGLVTGSINVSGTGSASVTNEGAVIGTTSASSQATDNTFAETIVNTSVFVPGPDGGTVNTRDLTRDTSNASSGGDVTGVYAGTNGAVQFGPFGGASDGSVSQFANGDSSALVSGTIFGNFTGDATGSEFSSTFADTQVSTFDADGDQRSFDREYAYAESNDQAASDSLLAVDGGRIEGNASLFATGSASVQIGNGGSIGGSLTATAQGFGSYDYSETYDLSQTFDEDGNFTGSELNREFALEQSVNQGDVTVAIADGAVEGSASMNGAGGANNFSLGEEGTVGGGVFQNSQYSAQAYTRSTTSVSTATDTTSTLDYAETRTASGGDVTATVAGTIGNGDLGPQAYGDVASAGGTSLSLRTDAGDASATVTGQVRNGIQVIASGSDTTLAQQQERENGVLVADAEQRTSTATGGTASLIVDADDLDTPANFGGITVAGLNGSTVTIGADSSVLAATNGASMQVGGYFSDTAFTREGEYTGTDLTGQTTTSSSTVVGGAASLTNNGRIGYDGGAAFDGDNAFVNVVSPTSAEATNNGQIFGSIALSSLYADTSSTTTSTDLGDVTRVDTTTTVYEAGGGSATLTNDGLVTGDASMEAVDGTVVNNGVLRGDLSLGGSVDNYTTQSVDTLTQFGEEEVLDLFDAIEQGYAVEQNGLVGGTISLAGVFGNVDDEARTSTILGDISLNSGSVTGGGVVAEYDEETGERFTETNVTLDGSGYLGLGDDAIAALEDAFGDIDPGIAAAGDLSAYAGGARILGVDSLTKTGNGVFLITGADFAPTSNTNVLADYTFDLGTFAINGGEIQLATASEDGVFGVRGDIANAAGLVLGSRVELPAPLFGTNASVTAIDGVEVYQNGNFSQSATGTLSVGVTPTLVRVSDPAFGSVSTSTNPLAVQTIGLGSGLFTTPENAFGQAFAGLGTGFLTVDGDMNLSGTVALVSPTGGIFTNGQTVDIASVSGTLTQSATVDVNSASNFVSFDLATRTEGGRTILFATATRDGFETAGDTSNAVAAGAALSQAFPDVIATIQAGSGGGIGLGGDQFVLAQDFANLFVGMDTLLTMDGATTVLNELASGEFYGSLTNLETTAPFVDAISSRRVPADASGLNIWLAPSGDFVELEGDTAVGSRDIEVDNYGASGGFGIATGNGEIGVGFGYGRINAETDGALLNAQADTWMVGAYVRQGFGNFSVGADLIYGWSDWNATRSMPTLSRTALAEFDSSELRGDLRAEYMFDFGGGWAAPFGQVSFRKFEFDGFTEEEAGAVSLVVEDADDTVFTPTLGLRAGTRFEAGLATLRPEITLAYSFDDDNSSFRDVAYLGAPTNSFRLQGVDPEGYFTIGAGLFADIGANSGAFLRGSYATGDNVDAASISAGVTIGF